MADTAALHATAARARGSNAHRTEPDRFDADRSPAARDPGRDLTPPSRRRSLRLLTADAVDLLRYTYVGGDPANYTDESGLMRMSDWQRFDPEGYAAFWRGTSDGAPIPYWSIDDGSGRYSDPRVYYFFTPFRITIVNPDRKTTTTWTQFGIPTNADIASKLKDILSKASATRSKPWRYAKDPGPAIPTGFTELDEVAQHLDYLYRGRTDAEYAFVINRAEDGTLSVKGPWISPPDDPDRVKLRYDLKGYEGDYHNHRPGDPQRPRPLSQEISDYDWTFGGGIRPGYLSSERGWLLKLNRSNRTFIIIERLAP